MIDALGAEDLTIATVRGLHFGGPIAGAEPAGNELAAAGPGGRRVGSWGACTALASVAMSCPATRTVPPSAFTSVVSTFTVVVFPAPFGPGREKTVPAGTSRSMPSRTILSPYAFRSPEAAIAELLMRPPSAPGLTRPPHAP